MTLTERINLLAQLGEYLQEPPDESLEMTILRAKVENAWFTPENTKFALKSIATQWLQADKLENWAKKYPISKHPHPQKTVAIIMAGNIPLVGFHDWLCVFLSGQKAKVKLSDKDKCLLPFLIKKMGEWNHESWEYTEFLSEGHRLAGFDAVIATGSNNTSRYFEQYFGKYKNIIRKHRNSVAVLTGEETFEELYALGSDVFTYFGLGCRNVSKLYVPRNYNFDALLTAMHEYREIVLHDKYKNNFDYNYTLYILNKMPHHANGCILLREDISLAARIASLHFEYYENADQLAVELQKRANEIQCIAAKNNYKLRITNYDTHPVTLSHGVSTRTEQNPNPEQINSPFRGQGGGQTQLKILNFGEAQNPSLEDYADGVDVMEWLNNEELKN